MRVLIVEDEALLAMSYRMALDEGECQVVGIAADAEEAVRLAKETLPEVVLMDIKLRGLTDGIEAAMRINDLLNIPIVYMTGNSDEATRERALKTHPRAYLEKPIDCEKLHKYLCTRDGSYD